MQNNIIFWIDVETTGTDPEKHDVIQVGLIVEKDGVELERHDFKVRPFDFDAIEQKALEVNGITVEELKQYPPALETYAKLKNIFCRYINKYDKTDKAVFGGFCSTFDFNFMNSFFNKVGDKYFRSFVWFPTLDVSVIAFEKLLDKRSEMPNFKLGTVAEMLGVKADGGLHDALVDIVLTRDIYHKLKSMV